MMQRNTTHVNGLLHGASWHSAGTLHICREKLGGFATIGNILADIDHTIPPQCWTASCFTPSPPPKPPRSPNDATLSASFDFFRALFCRNLCVSSSWWAWGNPPPFHVLWNVFPFAHFQNLSYNRGRSRREWGIVWLLLPKIHMHYSEFLLVNLPLTRPTSMYSESKSTFLICTMNRPLPTNGRGGGDFGDLPTQDFENFSSGEK